MFGCGCAALCLRGYEIAHKTTTETQRTTEVSREEIQIRTLLARLTFLLKN